MSSIAAAIQDICVLKLADHIDACSNLDVRVYTAMQWQKKVSAYLRSKKHSILSAL